MQLVRLHQKIKYIWEIKSVKMMSSKFGFRSEKYCHDWYQLTSLTTGWILHIGGPSDLGKGMWKSCI